MTQLEEGRKMVFWSRHSAGEPNLFVSLRNFNAQDETPEFQVIIPSDLVICETDPSSRWDFRAQRQEVVAPEVGHDALQNA